MSVFCLCLLALPLHAKGYVCWEDTLLYPEQASTQLDALGDHQKLYNELTQAEAQQRKLTREQVSKLPGVSIL